MTVLEGRIAGRGVVSFRGMRTVLCGPVSTVRRPPPFLVSGLLREFKLRNTIFGEFCMIGDGVLVVVCQRFWFLVGLLFFAIR